MSEERAKYGHGPEINFDDQIKPLEMNVPFSELGKDLAFSTLEILGNGTLRHFGELIKRELFAAMAMNGMVGGYVWGNDEIDAKRHSFIAEESVKIADGLIKELEK